MKFWLILWAALFVWTVQVSAVEPDEIMQDPALEARAREVSQDLRCVVCQNQSIDDSNSGIAKKMRILVRDRIAHGDSNQEVKDYLVSRYGDFVLLKPPMNAKTMVLWFGPALMIVIGLVGIVFYYRRRSAQAAQGKGIAVPLTAQEQARLDALMKEEGSDK
ncbi:cytochrome c-type biogenesis protein CcmH [Terasakiella sp.]|jgi:cytochrome c-type biogenesis protein CcmH|uniref:cytochrome c-type biogenesis protein n=1 Tax=Terasakiella sp. TaxID=2034861 RepID=UPI003AA9C01C